jgi:hypothetical protein
LNHFTARALFRLVRRESPSYARFRRKVVTNLVTPKSHLSDATEGASRIAAVRNGHSRRLTAPEGRSHNGQSTCPGLPRRSCGQGLPRRSCEATKAGGVYGFRSSLD